MLPKPRYRNLDHHKYKIGDFSLLKISAIYGANGSGKSSLVRSLSLLQDIVRKEELPFAFEETKFKFRDANDETPQSFVVEFFQENIAFLYALEFSEGIVRSEELYKSGLGKHEDELIFERNSTSEITSIKFLDAFERDAESQVLKRVIEKNLTKPNAPILKLLTTLDSVLLGDAKLAFDWFEDSLQIVLPESKPAALAHRIEKDEKFREFAQDIMCSFDIGISKLESVSKSVSEFFGEDVSKKELQDILKKLDDSPSKMVSIRSGDGNEIVILIEDGNIVVKELKVHHQVANGMEVAFDLAEESDGTIRLLDFIPAFREVITKQKVFVIDEIERSIHPLLIKELISKFSKDKGSSGQLIFTTHESNLLDQAILRQDEIWFTEKNKDGATDLYSLSDFKQHHTIDIRKGYLNGRYGSIPFLANLEELNWNDYDTQESPISPN